MWANKQDAQAWYKEYIKERKSAGLCTYGGNCNNPVEKGKNQCREHLNRNAEFKAKQRRERNAMGLCDVLKCKNPIEDGLTRCRVHLARWGTAETSLRHERIAAGLCAWSSKCDTPPVQGHKYCLEHILARKIAGYKRNARYRGFCWGLSDEEAGNILRQPCYYCGKEADPVFLGGIDRVDNSKGYTSENTKPCCFKHNNKKSGCSIEVAQKILEHQLRIGDESSILWLNKLTRGEDRE